MKQKRKTAKAKDDGQLSLLLPAKSAESKSLGKGTEDKNGARATKKATKKATKTAAPKTVTAKVDKPQAAAKPKPATPKPQPAARKKNGSRRVTAETMATKQREISVSEFFTKNRHLLGFDNPAKALLTTVKEAVDNSLDACEEAGILPTIKVEIIEIREDRYVVVVEDNGPGIVKSQIPKIFGKLLYGSKFHRLKQSRGQQGIGISAAGMYGQMTTGWPVVISSRTSARRPANQFKIMLDTAKNKPNIIEEKELEWTVEHGTRVEINLQGTYKGGKHSVDEFLEQVAIANPHAELSYVPPKGRPPVHYPRAEDELPPEPNEIKPHPHGVELGALMKLLKESEHRNVSVTLQKDFSRVSARVAEAICATANVRPKASPRTLGLPEIDRLFKAIPKVKIMAPRTDCVVPIGEDAIMKGLSRELDANFYTSATRPPTVYRGNPFRVEVGLAYGGSLRRKKKDHDDDGLVNGKKADRAQGPITLIRYANRVPLQYQQGAGAIFKAVVECGWRQYGLPQHKGGLPMGPMVLLVHLASVWVPFTSESKEAVAHYPEIIKEIKLAIRECGRKLASHLRRREKALLERKRRSIFEMYIGELSRALSELTGASGARLQKQLTEMAVRHTGGIEAAEEGGVTTGPGETEADGDAETTSEEE